LDPPPADPDVHVGDSIFLRAYHGRHVDMGGSQAHARWADRGEWQRFVVCFPSSKLARERLGKRRRRTPVLHGDSVCLRAHNGHLMSVKGGKVVECHEDEADETADFIVHVQGNGSLRHRSTVFLQSRHTRRLLDVDGSGGDSGVHARWGDFGEWQRFVVEKAQSAKAPAPPAAAASRKRRRTSCSPPPRLPGTPPQKHRRSSVATPQRRRLSLRSSFAPTPEKQARRRSSTSGPSPPSAKRRSCGKGAVHR